MTNVILPKVLVDSIRTNLTYISVGSCTCVTKTPEIEYHEETCRYRVIKEILIALGEYTKQ